MSGHTTDQVVLRGRDLGLGYGSKTVLSNASIEIRSGQFWFLIGPNGSGKTTLLNTLLGVLRPRAGTLERHPDLARRDRIGFVPQRCALNPSLPISVRELVSLGLVGTRVAGGERAQRLRWALERVGLEDLERASYWALSGGQRQRALVARALIRRPLLTILDEPTEGLDLPAEESLLATLSELNRTEGTTLLFVTHKLALAPRFATHAALFHSGTLLAGPRERVLERSAIERVFGGSATLDLIAPRPASPKGVQP